MTVRIIGIWLGIFLAQSLGAGAAAAATNDVFPGDYFPAEPGAHTVTLYGYDRTAVGPYASGTKLGDGELAGQIAAIRGVHFFSLADMTASAVIALTWADLGTSPIGLSNAIGKTTTGLGDLRLGLTIWPIKDRANAHYLGLTSMIIAPTGEYDSSQPLNYGENRWRLVFMAGWQKDLTPRFLVELAPELTLYGDNDDYAGGNRLAQAPSLALTGYLRSRVTPAFHLHLGGQLNWGGETSLNGADLNNPSENSRVNLGATWFLPASQQIILRLASETGISNGFRLEREIALRYQKSF